MSADDAVSPREKLPIEPVIVPANVDTPATLILSKQ